MNSRTVHTWYEDALGAEHSISVRVCSGGPRDIEIEDGLHWAAERECYEEAECAQEDQDVLDS